jgi:hypothetical protein
MGLAFNAALSNWVVPNIYPHFFFRFLDCRLLSKLALQNPATGNPPSPFTG